MPLKAVIKSRFRLILAVLLFFILLTSLLLTSDALQTSTRFGHLYSTLLLLSSTGLAILIVLIVLNLRNLLLQVRRRRAGARLTVRLVMQFSLLAIAPVLIVYYFSVEFLHHRLDGWFDVKVEQTLQNALELSRASLDAQMREAVRQSQSMVESLNGLGRQDAALELEQLRERSGAVEASLLADNGRIIAFSSVDMAQLLPSSPGDKALLQVKQQPVYIGLESLPERGLHIRVLVPCQIQQSSAAQTSEGCLLHTLFPLAERLNRLAEEVESGSEHYKQLAFLRQPLKVSFTLVLSLVLFISITGAVWMAFYSARRLVQPIRDLVEGTRAVAEGDYNTQVPADRVDELGFLAQSFNDMTRRISQARDDVKRSQQLADAQRAYLEIVLERLSSGVLSLDHRGRLRTRNAAAEHILEMSLSEAQTENFNFVSLYKNTAPLQPLCEAIERHIKNDDGRDWQEEVTLFCNSGRKTLMCRGTRLREPFQGLDVPRFSGHVIVFDDVTDLIRAQRNAAWSEVARRLAHEIKNPLTPIQLSAERLRHKYLPSFPDKEAETLDRMTHTIVQQVESLKELVNAFSDYARTPQLHLIPLNLNDLISEVLELYHFPEARIDMRLDPRLPVIEADQGRLRQVLHNLLKNALEASAGRDIQVITRYYQEASREYVELRVSDDGPGIEDELLERVFEPYFTTKSKGTGLGLAIVKKIVDEHGGLVWMENKPRSSIVVHLPCSASEEHSEKLVIKHA